MAKVFLPKSFSLFGLGLCELFFFEGEKTFEKFINPGPAKRQAPRREQYFQVFKLERSCPPSEASFGRQGAQEWREKSMQSLPHYVQDTPAQPIGKYVL